VRGNIPSTFFTLTLTFSRQGRGKRRQRRAGEDYSFSPILSFPRKRESIFNSGFLVNARNDRKRYLKRRLPRLLIPYTLIFLALAGEDGGEGEYSLHLFHPHPDLLPSRRGKRRQRRAGEDFSFSPILSFPRKRPAEWCSVGPEQAVGRWAEKSSISRSPFPPPHLNSGFLVKPGMTGNVILQTKMPRL